MNGSSATANMKEAGITGISGPVSLQIFIGEGRTVYLMGDEHYSKEYGCMGKIVKMNKEKTSLINLGAPIIELDAMLHVWLLYNNANGIITDVLYERPLSKKNYLTSRRKYSEHDSDWLNSISKIFDNCIPSHNMMKYCVYSNKVRIHSIDIRQDISPGYFADIFTWISIISSEIEHTDDAINMLKLIKLVMNNYEKIFVGYTDPMGLIELKKFQNIIDKSNLGDVGEESSKTIGRAIINMSTTKKIIVAGKEQNVRMHKIAAQLIKLEKRNPEMAKAIVEQANIYVKLNIEEARYAIFDGGTIDILLTIFEDSDVIGMLAYNKSMKKIAINLLGIGALGMDLYALARAFYYDNKEIIIYAGNKHILNYIDIINATGKYKNKRNLGSISVTDTTNRCIMDPTMERYLKLGFKTNYVFKNKILENAQYKLSDYNLLYLIEQ